MINLPAELGWFCENLPLSPRLCLRLWGRFSRTLALLAGLSQPYISIVCENILTNFESDCCELRPCDVILAGKLLFSVKTKPVQSMLFSKGSRTRRKSAKVVTMSLEGGAPPPPRQLVTAWGCGADPPPLVTAWGCGPDPP